MDREPLIQFIESYVPAPRPVLVAIAGQFEERVFARNDLLVRAGKVSNDYVFLAEGFVRAFTVDTDGNEVTTSFYPKNRAVFEVSSFFRRIPSTETIQALTDSRGYSLTFEHVNQLFHAVPEFREFGRAMLVKEFAAFKERTLSLINTTAEERYAELMRTNKEVFQYAQLKQIASYLGITDSSLSRIRREFARRG